MREIDRVFLNQKNQKPKALYKSTRNSPFKLKREKTKKSLFNPAKKYISLNQK